MCCAMVAPTKSSTLALSSCDELKSFSILFLLIPFAEVDYSPFLVCFMCPFVVAVDGGRYFHTSAEWWWWNLLIGHCQSPCIGFLTLRRTCIDANSIWCLLILCHTCCLSCLYCLLAWHSVVGIYHSPIFALFCPFMICITEDHTVFVTKNNCAISMTEFADAE